MADTRNQTNPQQTSSSATPQRSGNRDEPSRSIERAQGSTDLSRTSGGGSPFSFMRRFMSDMDRLFSEFGFGSSLSPLMSPLYGESALGTAAWAPQVDVFQRNGQLVVHADLPGVKNEDLRVNVHDDVLTIAGEKRHEHEQRDGGVYQCERSYGAFQRSVALPEGIDPESIQASFQDGVLEVTMPMPKGQTASKGRNIPIGAKASAGTGGVKH